MVLRLAVWVVLVSVVAPGCRQQEIVERGWIGGRFEDVPRSMRLEMLSMPLRVGGPSRGSLPDDVAEQAPVLVGVHEETPAYQGGLRQGDVILSVDEKPIATSKSLYAFIDERGPGTTVNLQVYRLGKRLDAQVPVGKERYEDSHTLLLGLPLPFWCDLLPNPDFNVFGLLAFRKGDGRRELLEARTRRIGDASLRWEARLPLLRVRGMRRVLSQEP
jgi:membrane-associated protease RseP (regulator of RpoE activity)